MRAVGRKRIFLLIDLLPVSIPTYMPNLKVICQGEVCKIDRPPSLSIKLLKNLTPGKDGKRNIFFKFEILATNIDWSQILKNICQLLLSLNNVLKVCSNSFVAPANLTTSGPPGTFSRLLTWMHFNSEIAVIYYCSFLLGKFRRSFVQEIVPSRCDEANKDS